MERLILESLEGSATAEQEQRLRAWRAASAENERLYREVARLWVAIPDLRPVHDGSTPPDAQQLLRRAGIRPLSPGSPRLHVRRFRWFGVAAAAVALVGVGFGVSRVLVERRPEVGIGGFGADEFVTGPSEVSTVTLRDGSVARLGPQTRLTLTGRGSDREVQLHGRAFFAVAHAPDRPFRILTSAGTVTALGTRFDLQADSGNLSLSLLEGRVVLSTPGKELSLQPGQAARVVGGTTLPLANIPDGGRLVEWAGNFLAFQQTPLSEAALEIERLYSVRITIADSALANREVTAWFADRSLKEVLRIICAATLAECSLEPGHVTMKPSR